jgi:hypothetical protein
VNATALAAAITAYLDDAEQLIGPELVLEGMSVSHEQAKEVLADFLLYVQNS